MNITKPKEYAAPEWTVQEVIDDQGIGRYEVRLQEHKDEIKRLTEWIKEAVEIIVELKKYIDPHRYCPFCSVKNSIPLSKHASDCEIRTFLERNKS